MSEALDGHDKNSVFHRIDDAIVANADPESVVASDELPATVRSRIALQPLDRVQHTTLNRCIEPAEVLVRRAAKSIAYSAILAEPAFHLCQWNGRFILSPREHGKVVKILQQLLVLGDRQYDRRRLTVLHDVFGFRIHRLHDHRLPRSDLIGQPHLHSIAVAPDPVHLHDLISARIGHFDGHSLPRWIEIERLR